MSPSLREICDSEDEDEPLSPGNAEETRVATLARGEIASINVQVEPQASAERSTDSTGELLRRAHLDLMASTQMAKDVSEPVALNSPSHTRPKRRLTDVSPPKSSAGKLKRIKTTPAIPSSALSDGTVPGATIPQQMPIATGDTIAGATIPSEFDPPEHTPPIHIRKVSAQQTPSNEQSSNLTPWSASVIGNSGVFGGTNNDHNSSDPPNSDDLLIGLPKEQYKPRPSRSRSEQVVQDDHLESTGPFERGTEAKRAKTIDYSSVQHAAALDPGQPLFPEHPSLEAPEFEALSPPSGPIRQLSPVPKLLPLDTTLPDSASSTITDGILPTQNKRGPKAKKEAKPKKQPGKRGRPRKNPLPEPVEVEEAPHGDFGHESAPPAIKDDVQVVISPTDYTPGPQADSSAQPPGGTHDVKSILDALNQKFPAQQPAPVLEDIPKNNVSNQTDDKENEPQISEDEVIAVKRATNATPEADESNMAKAASGVPRATADEQTTHAATATIKASATTAKRPGLATKGSSSSSSLLSWNAKGPVYRVGLSKTQRTQSLLKVIRGPRS